MSFTEDLEEVPGVCSSCSLFKSSESPKGFNFAYDCSDVANLSCPLLDKDGECQEPTIAFDDFVSDEIQDRAQFNITDEGDGDDQWKWVLKRISPTGFNVLSDIFAYITRFIVGLAIAALYPFMMSMQLKRGYAVPVSSLGNAPGDFFTAAWHTRAMNYSIVALSLIFLFALADFSHSLADIGLDFKAREEKGDILPILTLETEKRNKAIPVQLSGDPLYSRTSASQLSPTLDRISANEAGVVEPAIQQSRSVSALTGSYFNTVILMARGQSPFFDKLDASLFDRTTDDFVGAPRFDNAFNRDDLAVASLPLEIALDCSNAELVSVQQYIRGASPFETFFRSDDRLPNCTFTEERQSGIYRESGDVPPSAEILERSIKFVGLPTGDEVLLQVNGSEPFLEFEASPESKRLARDRDNWRNGREFFDVDAILLNGGNTTISLGKVVLGTGPDLGLGSRIVEPGGEDESFIQRREYGLVAEILGDCPERPSGLSTNGTVCYAIVTIGCDLFDEDVAPYVHEVYNPLQSTSKCVFDKLTVVWGRGFVADAELITVMGGIYGAVRPQFYDNTDGLFAFYGPLAALFALANVEERPSISLGVFPVVNVVYVFFMLVPVVLSLVVIVGTFFTRKYCLNVPSSSWELMVTAKEQSHLFPVRPDKHGKFPEENQDLFLAFHDALEQEEVFHDAKELEDQKQTKNNCHYLEIVHAPQLSKKGTSKTLDQHHDIETNPAKNIVRTRVVQIIDYEDGSEERKIINDTSGFSQDEVTV